MSEGSPNIYQRINAVQKEVREVRKVRQNEHFKYKFIGHDDVTTALRDAKAAHGIVTIPTINSAERAEGMLRLEVLITYVNADEPQDRFTVTSWGESFAEPTRSNPQPRPSDLQMGKALSYAVKLAELKLFQLIGDSTADSEEGQQSEPAAATDQRTSVSEEELQSLLETAEQVKDRAGLDGLNAQINKLIKHMSKEQIERLRECHGRASARALEEKK